jgi:hypothetical protein
MCVDKIYYVYGYIRTNESQYGKAGSYYYIGKGKGNRLLSKHHTVKPPIDKSKIYYITGGMNEMDALQAEMLLIYYYGRIDLGTGCLRNRTDGGDGHSTKRGKPVRHKLSPESLASFRAKRCKTKEQLLESQRKRIARWRAKHPYIPKKRKKRTYSAQAIENFKVGASIRWSKQEEKDKQSLRKMGNKNCLGRKKPKEEIKRRQETRARNKALLS